MSSNDSGSWDSLFPSKFFKQTDVVTPIQRRISHFTRETMPDGAVKPTAHFEGDEKMLVIGKVLSSVLAEEFGPHPRDSIGKVIELFRDPNVTFAGRRVGAVRIRVPPQAQPASQLPAAAPTTPQPSTASPARKKKGAATPPPAAAAPDPELNDELPDSLFK